MTTVCRRCFIASRTGVGGDRRRERSFVQLPLVLALLTRGRLMRIPPTLIWV